MKQAILKFLESFSIVGFGLAYWLYDLRVATAVLMVLMTVFIAASLLCREKLNPLQWGTWIVVVGLGAASLLTQNDSLIKWKTTLINGAIALVFAGSHLIGEKTILERVLTGHLVATREKLRTLSLVCIGYFLLVAALNLVVAYTFETSVWVQFKVVGLFIIHVLFVIGCFFYLWEEIKQYMETQGKK